MGSSGSKNQIPKKSDEKVAGKAPAQTRPQVQVSEIDLAALDVKKARDSLKKFRNKLDAECVKLTARARVLMTENMSARAMTLLKLRKYKTSEADKMDNQLSNLERMIGSIEVSVQNSYVLNALKEGTQALNKLQSEFTLDEVETILSESEEAIEAERAFSNMLLGLGPANEADEALLQRELDEFFTTHTQSQQTPLPIISLDLPVVPSHPIVNLPAVPTGEVVSSGTTSESAAIERVALSM